MLIFHGRICGQLPDSHHTYTCMQVQMTKARCSLNFTKFRKSLWPIWSVDINRHTHIQMIGKLYSKLHQNWHSVKFETVAGQNMKIQINKYTNKSESYKDVIMIIIM